MSEVRVKCSGGVESRRMSWFLSNHPEQASAAFLPNMREFSDLKMKEIGVRSPGPAWDKGHLWSVAGRFLSYLFSAFSGVTQVGLEANLFDGG